jgi:hypothetical protein
MLFAFDVTVPANTQANSPVEEAARLVTGDVVRIGVRFRDGPAWMVHSVVEDGLHRIVPANPDGTVHDDDDTVWSTMRYPLVGNPPQLMMRLWSPDTFYDHLITFYFEVEPAGSDSWDNLLTRLFAAGLPAESVE